MKSVMSKLVLSAVLLFAVPFSWAGCAQGMSAQCRVIENGQAPQEVSCDLSVCSNVIESLSHYSFNDGHYLFNSYTYKSKKEVIQINGEEATKVKVNNVDKGFYCYKSINKDLILCAKEGK